AYEDFGPRPSSPGNGGTAPSGQPLDLLVTRSINGGTAFSAPTIVASAVRARRFSYFFPEFPGVAGGPHGTVYLAWSANRDVLLRRSTNDGTTWQPPVRRSEEHTSELQSHLNLVCRLLLEKKKQQQQENHT